MKIKKSLINLSLFLSFLLLTPAIYGATNFDHVISNSADWKDVYSIINYANLNEADSDFLVSTPHGNILLNNIRKTSDIRVITSKENPFVFNYLSLIKSKDFKDADEIEVKSANIDLIEEMPQINNFVIVSDSYGYNAIAVAPYAQVTNSWVFLANRQNIYQIDDIISKRKVSKLVIYGFVDPQVTQIMQKHNPETIDTGDRFKDNVELVKKYLLISPTKQIILTNGEFIERELLLGKEPVLFTGRENVPDQIRDYIKDSEIEVGVLIGNDLIGAATNIRRSAGISVMVKFARGAREQTEGIAAVEGLDLFPVPTPSLNLSLDSINYNKAKNEIEITYKGESNIPIYVRGTLTITSNIETKKLGDSEPIFIFPGDYKTVTYPVTLKTAENLQAELFALYGDSPSSLDRTLNAKLNINSIEILDDCQIQRKDIRYVKYSKQRKEIIINIQNPVKKDCFVDVEIENIVIGFKAQTIGTTGSEKISAAKSKKISISQELTESDLEKNPFVELVVSSGEKENNLVNLFPSGNEDNKFPLEVEGITVLTYAIIALIILIIILIIILFIVKKRENERDY